MVILPQVKRAVPVLALLLLAGLTGCGRSERPIYIGVAGALSDPIGEPMRRAAQLAIGEINAAGGVRGRPLALIERDDFANPDSAVRVAEELYSSDAVAVVGHLFSGTTLAAAPIYNGGNRPLVAITPSSSAPEVSGCRPTPSACAPATSRMVPRSHAG
jgi:branched-chain amino acid transport system substrate-binding protein